MEKIFVKVEGMTCGGCVQSIQKALKSQNGISSASADLDSGMVTVEFDSKVIEKDSIEKSIEEAGFGFAS